MLIIGAGGFAKQLVIVLEDLNIVPVFYDNINMTNSNLFGV